MDEREARAFLEAKDRWVVLTTIGPDGFPHSVPMGYFLHGDHFVMGCKDGTQKVRNIERQPKVSVLWENGRQSDEMIAVMVRGIARVVRDDTERLRLKQEACRQRGEEPPTTVGAGFVYIEVQPTKTIRWRKPR